MPFWSLLKVWRHHPRLALVWQKAYLHLSQGLGSAFTKERWVQILGLCNVIGLLNCHLVAEVEVLYNSSIFWGNHSSSCSLTPMTCYVPFLPLQLLLLLFIDAEKAIGNCSDTSLDNTKAFCNTMPSFWKQIPNTGSAVLIYALASENLWLHGHLSITCVTPLCNYLILPDHKEMF